MLKVKVKQKIWETKDACSFYFEHREGNTLFYKPGQFLTLLLSINGEEVRRPYSFCTIPVKDKFPGVTVKRVEGGLVSNYLLDNVQEGQELECLYPAGTFFAEIHPLHKKEYVLVASGSGITPLYSILQTVLFKEPGSNVILIYCNRDEDSIIYKSKLDTFEFQFADRLKVVHVLSQPTNDWMGFRGRLDANLLENLVSELVTLSLEALSFFLCGPTLFMKDVEATFLSMGFTQDRIRKEDFGSFVSPMETTSSFSSAQTKEVTIIYRKNEDTFLLSEGQTILDAALDNGVRMPYSCRMGVCTACLGTCIEGEVDLGNSDALSENEKKKGYVLTCIGKPISDKVVIQID